MAQGRSFLFAPAMLAALSACTVGPDYTPAAAPNPEKFKELKGKLLKGWKVATPSESVDPSAWWTVYHDPKLDALERQVEISNQTVAQAAAAYEQARTLIREAQAMLYPTVTASYGVTRQYTGGALVGGSSSASTTTSTLGTRGGTQGVYTTTYTTAGNLTWTLDVWGRIRRQIESNMAGAQVSAADLDNAKLTAQAQLATAYFNRLTAYSLKNLLDRTAAEYQRTLTITRNQYRAGTAAEADVVAAETQLLATQAAAINTGVAAGQNEHAIAMLIGKAPSELDLPHAQLSGSIPPFPVGVPSTLLERRPDIAAAERMMQEENALIGVAVAAYYPDITLNASLTYTGMVPLPINPAHEIWALGGLATQTIFEGGLRSAQVDLARATYWQSVGNYRQTVLTALQQVEDQLTAIRVQTAQLRVQEKAVAEARKSVTFYLNQYKAGVVAFTSVVVAEATLLADEQAALATRQNLFLASVALIEALGGGWDRSKLPPAGEVSTGISLLPQL